MNKQLLYFLLAVLSTALLLSCTSAPKHLAKAKYKDEAYVAKKTREWWPCITTDSSTEVVVKPSADSTAFYKHQADSLLMVKRAYRDSIAIRYKDSCRSVKDNYENGFNLGYEVGKYEGLQDCIPDTFFIRTTKKIKDSAEVFQWMRDYDILENKTTDEIEKQQDKIVDQGKKIKRQRETLTYLWLIIAAIGLLTAFKIYRKITLR